MEWHDPIVGALCARYGENDPVALVIRLCRQLVEDCGDTGKKPRLKVLASMRNISNIQYAPVAAFTGCSGWIVEDSGAYAVTVDDTEARGRRLWSLAHEIVHTFFLELGRRGPASAEEERLCDIGAGELVMPVGLFLRTLEPHGLCFEGIRACQSEFGASFDASARRAVQLSETPACFLVATMHRTNGQERWRRGNPELRVESWTVSPTWRDQGCYKNIAFRPESLVWTAFGEQTEVRAPSVRLGTKQRDGVYSIEAVGYAYPRRGDPDHKQVSILLQLPLEDVPF